MIVKEVDTPDRFGDRPYYGFEHITMVPMNQKLIDVGLLDDKEKAWVNL
jgi:Xaa-Pro aminopeptidase